jgi:hypothetical protein
MAEPRILLSDEDIEQFKKSDEYNRTKIFLDFVLYLVIIVIVTVVLFVGYNVIFDAEYRNIFLTTLLESFGYILITALGLLGFSMDKFRR